MRPKVRSEVGEIVALGERNFEWRIFQFFSLSEQVGDCYFSPDFYSLGCLWYLRVFPNGHIADGTEGCITLSLGRNDTNSWEKTVKFILGIRKWDGTEEIPGDEQRHTFSSDNDSSNEVKFLKRSKLIKRRFVLVPSGTLTVTCIFSKDEQLHIEEDSPLERLKNLTRSLKNALHTGESTDVVLKLKSREIPAHRVILKSRSAVFKKILDCDMRENRSGVIELVDDDEEAFDVVLSHIYSGEAEKLDTKNVCEVYKLAHKYNLQDLMRLCCSYMKKNMSPDLICDVIAVAYMYEEPELKERAKNYFVNNITEIRKTEKWRALKDEKPKLALDLFEYFAAEKASK